MNKIPNIAQVLSLLRKFLALLGAYLMEHGHAAAGTFFTGEDLAGLLTFIVALAWSHFVHADESPADATPAAYGSKTLVAALLVASCLFTGCMAQSVPRLTLAVDPKTHAITLSNPKDTTLKNFAATIKPDGSSVTTIESLTTVMNPDVITTTGAAQAQMISATAAAVKDAAAAAIAAAAAVPK